MTFQVTRILVTTVESLLFDPHGAWPWLEYKNLRWSEKKKKPFTKSIGEQTNKTNTAIKYLPRKMYVAIASSIVVLFVTIVIQTRRVGKFCAEKFV